MAERRLHPFHLRGECRLKMKKLSEAISDFDQALKIEPKNVIGRIKSGHLWAKFEQPRFLVFIFVKTATIDKWVPLSLMFFCSSLRLISASFLPLSRWAEWLYLTPLGSSLARGMSPWSRPEIYREADSFAQ